MRRPSVFALILFAVLTLCIVWVVDGYEDLHPPQIPPGTGPIVILTDYGGWEDEYAQWAEQIELSGRQVEVREKCYSACAAILYVPPERIRVSSEAEFWFHRERRSAYWLRYPIFIRKWILKNEGLDEQWGVLKGSELHQLYRLCGS